MDAVSIDTLTSCVLSEATEAGQAARLLMRTLGRVDDRLLAVGHSACGPGW
jgi:hypothetical protein